MNRAGSQGGTPSVATVHVHLRGAPTIHTEHRHIQFVSDRLVEQIIAGEKTASVVEVGEVDLDEDEYNHALVVGTFYDIYDLGLTNRCTIRITAMELCRWDAIPERLWRGETNASADEFQADHIDYFEDPADNFEFVAYYFELASG